MIRASIDNEIAFKKYPSYIRSLMNTLASDEVLDVLTYAATITGTFIEELMLSEYPPPQIKKEGNWTNKTDKQRRWWWYQMNQIAKGESYDDNLYGWKASYQIINNRKTLVIDPSSGYIRTGTLVRSLSYAIETQGNNILLKVGPGMARQTDAREVQSYAEYVIGNAYPDGNQALYHQGNWTPLFQLLKDNQKQIEQILVDAIFDGLNKMLTGTDTPFTFV